MRGPRARRFEGAIEARDVIDAVAARSCDEAYARALLAGEAEDEIIEAAIARLHREASATERDDVSLGHTDRLLRCSI